MSDEPRYTLHDAQQELARRRCLTQGHDWRVVNSGDGPVAITCQRCGVSHAVVREARGVQDKRQERG